MHNGTEHLLLIKGCAHAKRCAGSRTRHCCTDATARSWFPSHHKIAISIIADVLTRQAHTYNVTVGNHTTEHYFSKVLIVSTASHPALYNQYTLTQVASFTAPSGSLS